MAFAYFPFESAIVEKHYQSKRSMAVAYLMTCGSKALMVSDSLTLDEDNAVLTMLEALDEESTIIRDIMHQEDTVKSSRRLNHNLTSQCGIVVFKRGRNGKSRRIRLKLICTKTDGDCLAWKSNLVGGEKLFVLCKLSSITMLKDDENDHTNSTVVSSILPISDATKTFPTITTAAPVSSLLLHDVFYFGSSVDFSSTQFIRFCNESRNLDIQFLSDMESQACMRFLSSYIVKK